MLQYSFISLAVGVCLVTIAARVSKVHDSLTLQKDKPTGSGFGGTQPTEA
jgi:hypothetical protein